LGFISIAHHRAPFASFAAINHGHILAAASWQSVLTEASSAHELGCCQCQSDLRLEPGFSRN
jgi:hypothetical protein